MKKTQQANHQTTECYKQTRVPHLPSVLDFKHFSGYAGEYLNDLRHISPRETD